MTVPLVKLTELIGAALEALPASTASHEPISQVQAEVAVNVKVALHAFFAVAEGLQTEAPVRDSLLGFWESAEMAFEQTVAGGEWQAAVEAAGQANGDLKLFAQLLQDQSNTKNPPATTDDNYTIMERGVQQWRDYLVALH